MHFIPLTASEAESSLTTVYDFFNRHYLKSGPSVYPEPFNTLKTHLGSVLLLVKQLKDRQLPLEQSLTLLFTCKNHDPSIIIEIAIRLHELNHFNQNLWSSLGRLTEITHKTLTIINDLHAANLLNNATIQLAMTPDYHPAIEKLITCNDLVKQFFTGMIQNRKSMLATYQTALLCARLPNDVELLADLAGRLNALNPQQFLDALRQLLETPNENFLIALYDFIQTNTLPSRPQPTPLTQTTEPPPRNTPIAPTPTPRRPVNTTSSQTPLIPIHQQLNPINMPPETSQGALQRYINQLPNSPRSYFSTQRHKIQRKIPELTTPLLDKCSITLICPINSV